MFTNTKKFNKEIDALHEMEMQQELHPLKREQIKQVVLQRALEEKTFTPVKYSLKQSTIKLLRYGASVLVGLSLVGGTAFAANTSKPGDLLFPVKKATEQIRIRLAHTEETKAKLKTKFAEERVKELIAISTSVTSASSTGTPTTTRAQIAAEAEVNNALSGLQGEEDKLRGKGSTSTAAVVQQTIVRLQTSLRINRRGEDGDNRTATPDSNLNIQQGPQVTPTSTFPGRRRIFQKRDGRGQINPLEVNVNATSTPPINTNLNTSNKNSGQNDFNPSGENAHD